MSNNMPPRKKKPTAQAAPENKIVPKNIRNRVKDKSGMKSPIDLAIDWEGTCIVTDRKEPFYQFMGRVQNTGKVDFYIDYIKIVEKNGEWAGVQVLHKPTELQLIDSEVKFSGTYLVTKMEKQVKDTRELYAELKVRSKSGLLVKTMMRKLPVEYLENNSLEISIKNVEETVDNI